MANDPVAAGESVVVTKEPEHTINVIDSVEYAYRKFVAEMLSCDTCGAVFMTQVNTGRGVLFTYSDDTPLCKGCEEICTNLDITEQNAAKPS